MSIGDILYIKILIISLIYLISISELAAHPLRVALSSAPNNLNPFYSYDANAQNLNRLLHLSLIDFTPQMRPYCRACERYEERIVGKKHILRFYLKHGLQFHDGTEITAKSIQKVVYYYQDEKVIKSGFRFAFKKIKDVKIIDNYTVEFIYEKYDPDHISDLVLLKLIKLSTLNDGKSLKKIIGAGPFVLIKLDELEIELQEYQGVRRILFKVVKDETTLALKLLHNEIDISVIDFSPRKLLWLKRQHRFNFKSVPGVALQYVAINEKNPLLAKREMRQVLKDIIPIRDLVKYKLHGNAIAATGFFPPAFSDFYQSVDNSSKINRIDKLLKQIGAVKHNQKWYWKNRIIKFDWLVVNNKNSIEIARVIKSYIERYGITINVITQEWGSYYKRFKRGDYDLLMGRWVGFTGPSILRYAFHSSKLAPKGGNRIYYVNHQVDKLLDRGLSEVDHQKQVKLIKKVLNILDKDIAYIYMWYPQVNWVMQQEIEVPALFPNGNLLPLMQVKWSERDAKEIY